MFDYNNLKYCYITTIPMGLAFNAGYEEAKRGNDLLHKFCEQCIDMSNYNEIEKQRMKLDLEIVKDMLSKEIEQYFHRV